MAARPLNLLANPIFELRRLGTIVYDCFMFTCTDQKSSSSASRGVWLLAALIAALALLFIGMTIWLMGRGFDFTDESFYLMMSQEPQRYDLIYGLFGYGLHPLFELSGGSIGSMRRIGAILLIAAGVVVSCVAVGESRKTVSGVLLVIAGAFTPMIYYHPWIPMPSYNWLLALASYALFVSILLLRRERNLWWSALFSALAAILVAFTRPQNALAFGAIYGLAGWFAIPGWWPRLKQALRVITFGVVFLVPCFFLLPIATIFEQVRAYTSIFGMSHPIQFSFVQQQIEFVRSYWSCFFSIVLFGAAVVLRRQGFLGLKLPFAILAFVMIGIALVQGNHSFGALVVGPLPVTMAWCLLTIYCWQEGSDQTLALLLATCGLIPWAATLGGATSISNQMMYFSGISLFTAVFATSLVARSASWVVIPTVSAALFFSYSSVRAGLNSPYRLAAPIQLQTHPVNIGGHQLLVDERTRDFIDGLQRDARSAGFCYGDDAIDLSGSIPGAVPVMGGHQPVFPWLFTGYPFSNHLARSYLALLGAQRLAQSWLLMSQTRNSFTTEQWEALGVNFDDYRVAGVELHPVDATEVTLFAPRNPVRLCNR